MNQELYQVLSLFLQAGIASGLTWFGHFLWKLERRVYRLELRLNLAKE